MKASLEVLKDMLAYLVTTAFVFGSVAFIGYMLYDLPLSATLGLLVIPLVFWAINRVDENPFPVEVKVRKRRKHR